MLFEKLTEEARAAGFDDGEDARSPSHESQGIIDVTDRGGDPAFEEIPFAPDQDFDGDGGGDGGGGEEEGGEEEGR